jgi:sugar lactone lactonase YvrE
LLGSASSGAETRLRSVESDDVLIAFPGPRYEFLVPHVAACLENSLEFHRELYGWKPSEKPTVFLQDFADVGSGMANTVPNNWMSFGLAPTGYTYETIPPVDRFYRMANHEVAHLVTMDQATGADLSWRKFFAGKVSPSQVDPLSIVYNYLTNPRWNAPRWYHEGIAVFLETWMDGGIGRANGPYDEMVFRSMVLDDEYFYDIVGLESEGIAVDFQTGTNSYLYGTRFMSYLAYRHGTEKLVEWTARRPGSKAYFGSQFEHVYGVPLREEWERWIEFEHEWQRGNLDSIRENPTTVHRDLSTTALGSVSRAFLDQERGKIYFGVHYPGQIAHLAALDLETGALEKIVDLKGPAVYYVTSIAFDPERRVFFYTSDNWEWRDLWSLDLDTGERRRLANDFRVGDLTFDRADRSLWGIRRANGRSVLLRVPHPYTSWEETFEFPYGTDLYDIDVSPDGRLLTGGLTEIDGSQSLVAYSTEALVAGTAQPEKLFDFDQSLAANFTFSPDGKSLYGSSYYSGVSNVYRYDLERREMFVLTNGETGFFRPQPLSPDELFALRYSGSGFVPVAIPNREIEKVSAIRFLGTALAEQEPGVRELAAGSPLEAQFEGGDTGGYPTVGNLRLESVYPIVRGYKDSASAGVFVNLADPVGVTALKIAASYSPDSELETDERHHLDVDFDYWKWNFRGSWNRDDFYDLFGPTKKSRRGYSLGLEWGDILVYDDPRFWRIEAGATFWGDLETLPGYQEIAAPTRKLTTGWSRLEYEFVRKSLGAVDEEEGVRFAVEATTDYVASDVIPRLHSTLDFGFPLALDHSSVWLRTSAGNAFGEVEDPFANFFFGGFGNNYIDRETEKRYRELESFPGLEINEVGGRNFAKAMIEWNLPPLRFRDAGNPSLYLNWLRPAIFAGALQTNVDQHGDLRRTVGTIGAQLDLKVVLFSNLSSILSVGYATAFEDDETSDEFMISLKIL